MKLFGRDLKSEVAFVAEIGVNHEGNVESASRLIALAAEAGADAVKLQTYTPERFASASDAARLKRVRAFALDATAHIRLAEEARRLSLHLFSTAVTEDVVPLLNELFPAIKIASGDLTFEPVIRSAAKTGKPIILSTGASDLEEIDRAVGWVRDEIGGARLSDRLVLMQCTSAYPASIEEANVAAIPQLAARYDIQVGYSNHVIGPEACLAAIALGAPLIEVHFTDNKHDREFRDHALSMEPDDLRSLIKSGRLVRAALGSPDKNVQPSEIEIRPLLRKGLVAAHDLMAGHRLSMADIMFARPATSYPSTRISAVIGERLSRGIQLGELITPELFE